MWKQCIVKQKGRHGIQQKQESLCHEKEYQEKQHRAGQARYTAIRKEEEKREIIRPSHNALR
jgi:hypothetical protein